jgi:hypothetical protein
MEAQTSAFVHESKRRKFRALSHGVEADNSTSKVFPTITNDSSVCWPGSVVRGCPNYLTPQSNKGRTLPQPLSRTPYNRSVFQRSIKVAYWLSLQLISILSYAMSLICHQLCLSLCTSIQILPLGAKRFHAYLVCNCRTAGMVIHTMDRHNFPLHFLLEVRY